MAASGSAGFTSRAESGPSPASSDHPGQRPSTPWIPLDYKVDELILVFGFRKVRYQIPDGRLNVLWIEQHFKIHDAELDGVREKVDWDGFTRKRYRAWSTVVVTGEPGPRSAMQAIGNLLRWTADSLGELLAPSDDGSGAGSQGMGNAWLGGTDLPKHRGHASADEPPGRPGHTRQERLGCAAEPSGSDPQCMQPQAQQTQARPQQAGPPRGDDAAAVGVTAQDPGIPWMTDDQAGELLFVHGTHTVRCTWDTDDAADVPWLAEYFGLEDVELNGVREEVDEHGQTLKLFRPWSVVIVTGRKKARPRATSSDDGSYDYDDGDGSEGVGDDECHGYDGDGSEGVGDDGSEGMSDDGSFATHAPLTRPGSYPGHRRGGSKPKQD